ncbi:phosphoribosyltransferase [Conservatibacter flavescens]|nr:phosphoribosyltransferase [Conservatibacter flavescens]
MIYAMKGEDNLFVQDEIVEKLYAYAKKLILNHTFSEQFDCIVLIPSKHSITKRLGEIIHNVFNIPIKENFLRKNSVSQAILYVKSNTLISPSDKQSLLGALGTLQKCNEGLSIKNIKSNLRQYVPIFIGYNVAIPIDVKHILLVDDISSSGATFGHAASLVRKYCPTVEKISALTLFSPLK